MSHAVKNHFAHLCGQSNRTKRHLHIVPRPGFPLLWFVLTLALAKPLYWLMVAAPWGLRTRGQLTVESQILVFLLLFVITGSLGWVMSRRAWNPDS